MSFAKMPKPPSRPTVLRMRTPAKLPTGPKLYKARDPRESSSWTNPPPGFVGNKNSAYEWMIFKALALIFGQPEKPHVGPFIGAPPLWVYQKNIDSAVTTSLRTNIDFAVYEYGQGGKPLGLRVVTEAFHLQTDTAQQVYDALQRERIEEYASIADLYDYDFIHDPTGQAAVVVTKNALGLIERPNPLLAGTAIRGSRISR